MNKIYTIIFAVIFLCWNCADFPQLKPMSLAVSEGFINPIGFYDATPTFSWQLPSEVAAQSAYRIAVASNPGQLDRPDLWDSEKVASDRSLFVKYDGQPLNSRQKVYWRVKFWDENGRASSWSEVAHLELGLLTGNDWKAEWISLPREIEPDTLETGERLYKVQYLRKDFRLEDGVKEARLHITSKGIFIPFLNGEQVGEDFMTPGWTPYHKRIETLTYDVSDQLIQGDNAIGVVLAQGWYAGRINHVLDPLRYNPANEFNYLNKPVPKLLAQLEITLNNNEKLVVHSDSSWKGMNDGPIRYTDIYDGESYDANTDMPGWNAADFASADWAAVKSMPVLSSDVLVPKRHHTVKVKEVLHPVAITEPQEGVFVFDMGQNMVGIPEITIPVKKDQKVTLRFAEALNPDQEIDPSNYRTAKVTDTYLPKADGAINWKPALTFHGYRYVELSGFDGAHQPQTNWVKGLVLYSDFGQAGTFVSSSEKLNQLQENITWGLKGNFVDIPTDCPQRDERLGWTGDAQVFAPTSLFNADVHAFWSAWLQSVREEQFESGAIPIIVPMVLGGRGTSTGWADAATIIPWELYYRTGDVRVLEENYEMMKKLVGFYQNASKDQILDIHSFSDWLQPYPAMASPDGDTRRGDTPRDLIGTAFFARSVELTQKAAEVLNRDDEAAALAQLHDQIKKAFQQQFLDGEAKMTTQVETQTGYLLPLHFGLLSDDFRNRAFENLVRQIHKADNHLRTGFLGTPLLAPVLDNNHRADLMFDILLKKPIPPGFIRSARALPLCGKGGTVIPSKRAT